MTGGALWRRYVRLSQQDPDKRDWTYDCDGHPVPLVDGEPDYTRRYTIDMTGTGDYINDPTEDWDCAPPSDDGWIEEYVKQHVDNEINRMSWDERQKNRKRFAQS